MTNSDLQSAIELIKNGNKLEGEKELQEILSKDSEIELAWLWLSTCKTDSIDKMDCLNKALRINPNNNHAQKALYDLKEKLHFQDGNEKFANSQNKKTMAFSNTNQIQPKKSDSIEFIPAICPNCGGELRVPNSKDIVKCMYCGRDVIIHNSNQYEIKIEVNKNIKRLFELAQKAELAKNFDESYKYYSQVLENDSENRFAWLGKARSAAGKTCLQTPGLDEAILYIKTAIQFDNSTDAHLIGTINTLAKYISDYTSLVIELIENEYESKKPANLSPDPVYQMGKSIQASRLAKQIQSKFSSLFPQIQRSIEFCWKFSPSELVGKWIFYSLEIILRSDCSSEIKDLVSYQLDPISKEIHQIYPDLKAPKRKGCFIATATMGSENHNYVKTLRQFRDKFLVNNKIGNKFVEFYYSHGPKPAKMIEKYKFLRLICLCIIIFPAFLLAKVFIMANSE
jgi:tetratricopeptide (TPR) repeat protein